jgi:hypothetical protein
MHYIPKHEATNYNSPTGPVTDYLAIGIHNRLLSTIYETHCFNQVTLAPGGVLPHLGTWGSVVPVASAASASASGTDKASATAASDGTAHEAAAAAAADPSGDNAAVCVSRIRGGRGVVLGQALAAPKLDPLRPERRKESCSWLRRK